MDKGVKAKDTQQFNSGAQLNWKEELVMYKDVIQTVEDLTASYTDDFLSELMLFIDQMEPHDILAVMTLVVVFSLLAFNYGYKYGKDGKFKFGHVSVQLAVMIIIWIAECHVLDAAA